MATVQLTDVVVEYRDGNQVLRPIDGFSMTASPGELVLLMGPSGSGKTSLLSCLAGILSPRAGRVEINGVDLAVLDENAMSAHRRHDVGVVFQAFNLVPSLTAEENVAVPLLAAGAQRRLALARARQLLTEVGLLDRLTHRPGELSGGQQQRVAIARALAHDPAVILADEPTAHLDHVQAEGILRILRRLAAEGRVVIVSTHDRRLVPLADAVVDLTPVVAPAVDERPVVTLDANETLFQQGDPSDFVWVVLSGQVDILRDTPDGLETVATCGEGSYFGELGPLLGFPRSATARAATDGATVEGFDIPGFREAMGDKLPDSWGALAAH
ncbi:MAG TPA: ATP-binding cassette domain-containing protein [Nitriliruptorales bacterium]|jgi:putative ABC transport system ATP-binding protein